MLFDLLGRHFYKQIFTIFWNSQNPQNLTSEVYFLYATQHITELLSKTIRFVKVNWIVEYKFTDWFALSPG